MKESQNEINYARIAEAIRFIRDNRKEQPGLEAIAEAVNMSPFHFQRIFKEWAGITPKHFLQYLNVEYAKRILQQTHASLFDTAQEVGLSGTGRLHDLFVTIEGMTPGEYKNGGENLFINYSFAATPFGDILIASTPKGICSMEFADDRMEHSVHCNENSHAPDSGRRSTTYSKTPCLFSHRTGAGSVK